MWKVCHNSVGLRIYSLSNVINTSGNRNGLPDTVKGLSDLGKSLQHFADSFKM